MRHVERGIGQEVTAHQSESRGRQDWAFARRHFLPGSLHVERSRRQDKVGAKQRRLVRHVRSRLQSDDHEGREKSEAVTVGILSARQCLGKRYPIRRVVCKTFTVPNGFRDISHEKLFSGQLPTRVVVGLVTDKAFSGHRERNPFNFRHFNVTEISLYVDGQQQQDIKPMALNYADSHYIRAYNTLFSGTGKICRDEGIAIDRNDYANGYVLYTFDLTADLGDEENFNLIRQGSV